MIQMHGDSTQMIEVYLLLVEEVKLMVEDTLDTIHEVPQTRWVWMKMK